MCNYVQSFLCKIEITISPATLISLILKQNGLIDDHASAYINFQHGEQNSL